MNQITCADCDAPHTPNGFLTERGWVCRECGTDPSNANNTSDMPHVDEIEISFDNGVAVELSERSVVKNKLDDVWRTMSTQ